MIALGLERSSLPAFSFFAQMLFIVKDSLYNPLITFEAGALDTDSERRWVEKKNVTKSRYGMSK